MPEKWSRTLGSATQLVLGDLHTPNFHHWCSEITPSNSIQPNRHPQSSSPSKCLRKLLVHICLGHWIRLSLLNVFFQLSNRLLTEALELVVLVGLFLSLILGRNKVGYHHRSQIPRLFCEEMLNFNCQPVNCLHFYATRLRGSSILSAIFSIMETTCNAQMI